jgi:hypothetical protein
MKRSISFIASHKLKQHELTNRQHVRDLAKNIQFTGRLKHPIIVDKKSLVVLDGHHRLAALQQLHMKQIPVILVNYFSKQIKVYWRNSSFDNAGIKQRVIKQALIKRPFPYKTTRHYIKNRLYNSNIPLHLLC